MWMAIVFFVGMLVFLTFILFSKLYKFKGTKLKVRMSYGLALSLFITLFYLWQTNGNLNKIGKGLIFGIVLGIPFCFYSKRWLDSKIEGANIIYRKKNTYLNLVWAFVGFISMELLMFQGAGRTIMEAVWPLLGLCLSWFFSHVFTFYYVVKLERYLGAPILEDSNTDLKPR